MRNILVQDSKGQSVIQNVMNSIPNKNKALQNTFGEIQSSFVINNFSFLPFSNMQKGVDTVRAFFAHISTN